MSLSSNTQPSLHISVVVLRLQSPTRRPIRERRRRLVELPQTSATLLLGYVMSGCGPTCAAVRAPAPSSSAHQSLSPLSLSDLTNPPSLQLQQETSKSYLSWSVLEQTSRPPTTRVSLDCASISSLLRTPFANVLSNSRHYAASKGHVSVRFIALPFPTVVPNSPLPPTGRATSHLKRRRRQHSRPREPTPTVRFLPSSLLVSTLRVLKSLPTATVPQQLAPSPSSTSSSPQRARPSPPPLG